MNCENCGEYLDPQEQVFEVAINDWGYPIIVCAACDSGGKRDE